jgi:hypothetical protein
MEEHKKRGGSRVNAGRKKKDGVGTTLVSVRINVNHASIIRSKFSISDFISSAIREKLERDGLV